MAPQNIILYGIEASPPVRSTLMAAKALGITLQFKLVNTLAGEQNLPEYVKLNPQHTVPTLDDNGFIVWDSHAINTYLTTQYFEDSQFYPNDPKKRALIDQRLHFDSGVLFNRFIAMVRPILKEGSNKIDPELLTKAGESYDFLETFLTNSTWLVGDKPTLADISLVATISTAELLTPFDKTKYPNIVAWLDRCKAEPWYAANNTGLEQIKKIVQEKLKH